MKHCLIALALCVWLGAGLVAHANLITTTSYQFVGSPGVATSGTVYQTFNTTPGGQYQISFQGYASSLYTPTSLNFLFGDLLNQSLVGDLGQQYAMWTFGQAGSPLVNFNFFATANGDTTTLAFQYAMASEDYGISIRNLSVNRVPDSAATAALLSVAGTAVWFARRWFNPAR
jgi:hypothetical protein